MGLTETEAKAKGIAVEKGTFPWAASGRSLSLGRDEGMTKLLFDPRHAPPARRRDRRHQRRRAHQRAGARDRERLRCGRHRPDRASAPDSVGDRGRCRRGGRRHADRSLHSRAQEVAAAGRNGRKCRNRLTSSKGSSLARTPAAPGRGAAELAQRLHLRRTRLLLTGALSAALVLAALAAPPTGGRWIGSASSPVITFAILACLFGLSAVRRRERIQADVRRFLARRLAACRPPRCRGWCWEPRRASARRSFSWGLRWPAGSDERAHGLAARCSRRAAGARGRLTGRLRDSAAAARPHSTAWHYARVRRARPQLGSVSFAAAARLLAGGPGAGIQPAVGIARGALRAARSSCGTETIPVRSRSPWPLPA